MVTGYDPGDFVARPELLTQIVLDEDRPGWEDLQRLAIQTESPSSGQVRLRTKSGAIKWVDVVLTPVVTAEGRALGLPWFGSRHHDAPGRAR